MAVQTLSGRPRTGHSSVWGEAADDPAPLVAEHQFGLRSARSHRGISVHKIPKINVIYLWDRTLVHNQSVCDRLKHAGQRTAKIDDVLPRLQRSEHDVITVGG